MTTHQTAAAAVQFWRDAGAAKWFAKNDDFDTQFRNRFMHDHMAAAQRRYDDWIHTPEGSLALIILLDQFPRNAFRDTAHMFATDGLALHFARKALELGHPANIEKELRAFMYLPFEHAEDIDCQETAVQLCTELGGSTLDFAIIHHDIIFRFGRFPHRNPVLGRDTTDEEKAFLAEGGFKG
jgi:uncharacterized protein (DUF924 family)